jgi:hypothetical protein
VTPTEHLIACARAWREASHDATAYGGGYLETLRLAEVALDQAVFALDSPPDTLPAPPITPEPTTQPGTPAAVRRRSSDQIAAVRPDGAAARVIAELAKGKG